ncbi:hypothetical protein [Methylocapsa aurea]|uniref:hypothetical protein n=1 Tax=Methylocapsa aurea TaxID=663610 RepID=UPI003D18EDA9
MRLLLIRRVGRRDWIEQIPLESGSQSGERRRRSGRPRARPTERVAVVIGEPAPSNGIGGAERLEIGVDNVRDAVKRQRVTIADAAENAAIRTIVSISGRRLSAAEAGYIE